MELFRQLGIHWLLHKSVHFYFAGVCGYAMLMRTNKAETAVYGFNCQEDTAIRMCKVLARPWDCVRVCHLLLLFFFQPFFFKDSTTKTSSKYLLAIAIGVAVFFPRKTLSRLFIPWKILRDVLSLPSKPFSHETCDYIINLNKSR